MCYSQERPSQTTIDAWYFLLYKSQPHQDVSKGTVITMVIEWSQCSPIAVEQWSNHCWMTVESKSNHCLNIRWYQWLSISVLTTAHAQYLKVFTDKLSWTVEVGLLWTRYRCPTMPAPMKVHYHHRNRLPFTVPTLWAIYINLTM